MNNVILISPVVGNGTDENPFRPKFSDEYSEIKYEDITARDSDNQPGTPALVVIAAECSDEILQIVENDANYLVLDTEIINEFKIT
jgi:hypothetical protein